MNYNNVKLKYLNDYDFIDYINTLNEKDLFSLYHSYKQEINNNQPDRSTAFFTGNLIAYEEDKELPRLIPYFEKAIRSH